MPRGGFWLGRDQRKRKTVEDLNQVEKLFLHQNWAEQKPSLGDDELQRGGVDWGCEGSPTTE